jgi:LemA protein
MPFDLSGLQVGLLAGAAVLAFWMLGAYNRLVSLRSALGAAFAQVDEGLARRGQAATALAQALRSPLAAEQGSLDAIVAAQGQVASAAEVLRATPVSAAATERLGVAEAEMRSAASRVRSLVEQHPALIGAPEVAPHLATMAEAEARLAFARQLFNDAAEVYNDAVRLFPTRLLARLYGMGTAGRL